MVRVTLMFRKTVLREKVIKTQVRSKLVSMVRVTIMLGKAA